MSVKLEKIPQDNGGCRWFCLCICMGEGVRRSVEFVPWLVVCGWFDCIIHPTAERADGLGGRAKQIALFEFLYAIELCSVPLVFCLDCSDHWRSHGLRLLLFPILSSTCTDLSSERREGGDIQTKGETSQHGRKHRSKKIAAKKRMYIFPHHQQHQHHAPSAIFPEQAPTHVESKQAGTRLMGTD